MKTERISSTKNNFLFPILAVIIMLACIGCEDDPVIPQESKTLLPEQFLVNPEGTIIKAFNGKVTVEFSKGAVSEPNLVTMESLPLHYRELDGVILVNRVISITVDSRTPRFCNDVKIKLNYNPAALSKEKIRKANESALTIFKMVNYGTTDEKIESIGSCTVETFGHSVKGCIDCCGYYVIGYVIGGE